jgi:hypothetical protein
VFIRGKVSQKRAVKQNQSWQDNLTRGTADLVRAIGQALAQVTAQDALGWFVSCGYSF